jgi:glycosyltransferase involved in cell wall biosynthesis
VFIPCYNYGRYLRESTNSVLRQEGVDVRVLIIDDRSKDDSAEVAADLAAGDSRVEFFHHQVNRGHIRTYNEGIEWTSGDYGLLLSADDCLAPGALARAAAVMDRHPDVGLAYGRALRAKSAESIPVPADGGELLLIPGEAFIRYMCETGTNPVPTPTAVVRTSVQKEVGGYRVDLPHSGDVEMWMRVAAHSNVCALKACQGVYRWHGDNMQHQYLQKQLGDLPEFWRAFDVLFSEWGHKLAEGPELRRTIDRTLAYRAFWKGSRALDAGDVAGFTECAAFAAATYPEITSSDSWRRARVKQMLGNRLWPFIIALKQWARGSHSANVVRQPADMIGTWPVDGRNLQVATA